MIDNTAIFSNGGTITTIFNAGTISATVGSGNTGLIDAYGIFNNGGTLNQIINTGSIAATIESNPGAFIDEPQGILNHGTIRNLSNGQGGNGSTATQTALTYTGTLPLAYSIIIYSPTQYGQLISRAPSGAMSFGIFSGGTYGDVTVSASTISNGKYTSVLSGIASTNLTGATSGKYNGLNWYLSEVSIINGVWDLQVGPSTAETQQSLVNTASALQGTYTLQNSVLANSLSYDCTVFGANNVCVSAGGRNTGVSVSNGLNNTSALIIAAYRPHPKYRIGAYADQNLSVSNPGGTVNLGNNTPLIGLFGAWNERLDGAGMEVKVSAAYGQKNTTVTRQAVGTSEAGSGSSQLNSQGAQVAAKYGFAVAENTIVSPYVGVRYTQNNMNGYTEGASSSVTAPLTYSALNTNATTALAGVGAQYKFIPQATAFASAGVETDTNTSNGTYSATGITGLTPINFNANPVKTRPTATVGAYYDVEKNQRLGITGIYRQEPYQSVSTTTVMATYTVGL
ncbi:autotransporter outer membrane beta-barrel domain-containing protein [Polynucleobacter paneuropaeus]|uniref:autotransporter outer membrane beta-barrel domain-containing protein n=1 Tax=Polynucleobacter paneuropaeus TaxID=2527775 RepID=UPI001BFCDF12|nr:autotransporter outer membrane beta-barrel domain-containing protein [Polynucleobacter paneuropaeus]MBT8568168.1 autotransporter outer membrane beta-barrel domain-containing protein [Polynucleobacter paneuropaeus]MBT8631120.1 autotransporter outer membrane beta-barrel domain-containing protein [Polynucleobacter paneuropaeus]